MNPVIPESSKPWFRRFVIISTFHLEVYPYETSPVFYL